MKRNLNTLILALLMVLSGCKTPVPTISNRYKESVKEDIQIDIPEVYEAMQIALSLTDTYQSDPNLIKKDTPYYDEMMQHFSEHKSHPLVTKLDKKLKKAGAYSEINTLIRLQALNYSLRDGKLTKENRYKIPFVYNVAPYPLFLYHNNRQLINDFLKVSDFARFYSLHKNHYDSLVAQSRELNDYTGMKQWLEIQFPHVRNEAFLIVFSPLTGGLHNIRELSSKDGDKKQSIMFVNAPDYERGVWKDRPLAEKSAYASRFVFTEIDHSYVNPTTSLYIEQIEPAMQELKHWKTEKVTGGYNSVSLTFNEYMTWAVYTLYAYDTYPPDVFERVIESQVKFMVNNRGFTKFREFNNALLSLYVNKKEGQKVADLYPAIINWLESAKISSQNKVQPDYALLTKELEEVYDIDQSIRSVDWDTISSPEASIAFSMKMMAIDSVNQARVIPILEQHGWLPKSKVGDKAAKAIFYVVQHSRLATIEKYLPQMEELAQKGEASATDAAKMRDRLLSFQGKKQIYGTQASNTVRGDGNMVIWPIEDAAHVNERRKKVGFTTTVEEEAKKLGADYNPNEELPKKKANMHQ